MAEEWYNWISTLVSIPSKAGNLIQETFDELQRTLEEFRDSGWAAEENGRWHFTPEGFLLSNQLIVKLLEAQTDRRAEQTPWLREQVEQAEREPMPAPLPATFEEQFGRQGSLRGEEPEMRNRDTHR